jgi:hypothetical protein
MEQSILSLNSGELVELYHKINKTLTSHLLKGVSWDMEQDRIITLTEISKELTRRKIEVDPASMSKDSGLHVGV